MNLNVIELVLMQEMNTGASMQDSAAQHCELLNQCRRIQCQQLSMSFCLATKKPMQIRRARDEESETNGMPS